MTSIRRHLTLGLLAASALLLAASGAFVWLLVRGTLQSKFDAALQSQAAFIQANVEEEDGMLELELRLEALGPAGEGVAPTLFQVWSEGGATVLKSESLGVRSLPRLALPSGASVTPPVAQVLSDGTRVRAMATRFDAADDKKGLFKNLTMVTARSPEGTESTLRLLFWVLAGTGAAALVLMVPIIRLVLGRGLRPLGDLAARTAAIDVRQLHHRLPEDDSPVELRPIISRLNELLARVEASFDRERRFSSDVAHELRTPVAELKALGELAADWPDQATPAAFAQVRAICGEMEEVIARLTLLARAETGGQAVTLEDAALDELVFEVAGRFAEQTRHRELTLDLRLPPVRRRTDPALMRMIVTNLIGNAVHHAPTRSTIDVELVPAALIVRNRAPDLEPNDLPRLFERFWRKDAARTGYGHAGLGLSLSESLVELLGGALVPSMPEPEVLEMRLHFSC